MHNSDVSQHRKHFDVRAGVSIGSDQHVPRRSGDLLQHQREPDPDLPHFFAHRKMLPRRDLRRVLARTGIRLQVARSIYQHDHSPVIAVF